MLNINYSRNIFLFIILTISTLLTLDGQSRKSRFDFRFGSGISLLGHGDVITLNVENELNFVLNNYFKSSISFNIGRRQDNYYTKSLSFIQGNSNIFLSPFKNSLRNDFRFGTGFTYYRISEVNLERRIWNEDGVLIDIIYHDPEFRQSFGINLIFEDTFLFTSRYLISLKTFNQLYFNGDTNIGIIFKLGVNLY